MVKELERTNVMGQQRSQEGERGKGMRDGEPPQKARNGKEKGQWNKKKKKRKSRLPEMAVPDVRSHWQSLEGRLAGTQAARHPVHTSGALIIRRFLPDVCIIGKQPSNQAQKLI
jgi:hypothetical protein